MDYRQSLVVTEKAFKNIKVLEIVVNFFRLKKNTNIPKNCIISSSFLIIIALIV